jgi:hypothetical protein
MLQEGAMTRTRIFGPSGFRDNGLSKQRGNDEEVEVYGRTAFAFDAQP